MEEEMRDLTEEEKVVLKNIISELKKIPIFIGKYDAKHGSKNFMNGISTVMECLGFMISDEYGYALEMEFLKNMTNSIDKAKQ